MILGISASQGQGKSTVLSSLKEEGYEVIRSQTSRQILQEWGISLSDVDNNPKLRQKFQEEIIDKHYAVLKGHVECDEVFFIERTFADIFSYTLLSMGVYNEYSEWLNCYYNRCVEYQKLFSKIFFLTGLNFNKVEYDGVRSVNSHFSSVVETTIKSYLLKMENDNGIYQNGQVVIVNSPIHEDRLEMIKSFI